MNLRTRLVPALGVAAVVLTVGVGFAVAANRPTSAPTGQVAHIATVSSAASSATPAASGATTTTSALPVTSASTTSRATVRPRAALATTTDTTTTDPAITTTEPIVTGTQADGRPITKPAPTGPAAMCTVSVGPGGVASFAPCPTH